MIKPKPEAAISRPRPKFPPSSTSFASFTSATSDAPTASAARPQPTRTASSAGERTSPKPSRRSARCPRDAARSDCSIRSAMREIRNAETTNVTALNQ